MVAMFGSIIPAPLQIACTETLLPETIIFCDIILLYLSVVMIALEASFHEDL